ncbi:MAG: helix-turn-helix transcriptional regulator [Proteobacteria bacterium]|nr:helix-turn-helix transcriptional regulator [Pseudomonadota bacterium]
MRFVWPGTIAAPKAPINYVTGSQVKPNFSTRLTSLRKQRGLSQLELATTTGCSQRHVSFLELGRTQPSREMVHRLSMALTLSLRQSNELLLAAGFAPIWSETAYSSEALAPIRQALGFMLSQQEPFPAVVVDRRWNLIEANKGAVSLVEFLVGPLAPGAAINLADALVAPDVLRPHLKNWAEVVSYFVRSVETDAATDGTPETAALRDRLMGYAGVRDALAKSPAQSPEAPVLPMRFEKGRTTLQLFTTIATLGTPQDVTLQELRIESFFPMDAATRDTFKSWATGANKKGKKR